MQSNWENIQSVDDAGDVTKDGEQDVDEQVSTTAALKENSKRRQDDCENDLADVATAVLAKERHDELETKSCVRGRTWR